MIFGPGLITEIIKRRKRMTRRPVRQPALAKRGNGTTYWTRPFVPVVGQLLPIQPGRGKHAVCHVKIAGVRRERAGDITYLDARREGFRTTDDFKAYWVRLHDRAWIRRELVERAGCYDGETSIVTWILLRRFDEQHADTPVWAIAFDVVEDPDLYMGRQGREDYTPNLARAIDPAPVPPTAFVDQQAAKAAALAEEQRLSFKRDLEQERQRRHRARPIELYRGGAAMSSDGRCTTARSVQTDGPERAGCGEMTWSAPCPRSAAG